MKKACFFIIFLLFLGLKEGAAARVSLEERLQSHVKKLCENPMGRSPGSLGHEQAKEYLEKQMREIGLAPADFLAQDAASPDSYEVTTYIHTNLYRSFLGHLVAKAFPIARPGAADAKGYAVQNLIGVVKSRDPNCKSWRIIMAHYDHLAPINGVPYPGALDNASSVAAVLEVARMVAQADKSIGLPSHVMFAFTDREEVSDLGYAIVGAQELKNLLDKRLKGQEDWIAIALDLVGAKMVENSEQEIFILGHERMTGDCRFFSLPIGQSHIQAFCAPISILEGAPFPYNMLPKDMLARGDYRPFRDVGIPALFLTSGSPWFYHTSEDKPERLDYKILAKTTLLLNGLVRDSHLPSLFKNLKTDPKELESYAPAVVNRLVQIQREFLEQDKFYPLSAKERESLQQLEIMAKDCEKERCSRPQIQSGILKFLLAMHHAGINKVAELHGKPAP